MARRGSAGRRTRRESSREGWLVSFWGVVIAAAASYALVGVPVFSEIVAAVRSLAVVAGVSVAAGGALAATDRLPVHPVAPVAAAPGALAGAAVLLSVENVPPWVHVAALVAVACGLGGFLLITYAAADDSS